MSALVHGLTPDFIELVRAHRASYGLAPGEVTAEQLAAIEDAFDREVRRRASTAHGPVSPNRADRRIR